MEKERIKQLLADADAKGFLAHSGDALADGYSTDYYVPVDKVDDFVKFVACHPLVMTNASKPSVGNVLGLQRHKMMRVHRLKMSAYKEAVDSNVLFPTACLILDENPTHLSVLGNDNCKYWVNRYYFTGPVKEDGTVMPKKKGVRRYLRDD